MSFYCGFHFNTHNTDSREGGNEHEVKNRWKKARLKHDQKMKKDGDQRCQNILGQKKKKKEMFIEIS